MKLRQLPLMLWLGVVTCLLSAELQAQFWVTGYYPAYKRGTLPPSEIDFTTVTHLIHFALQVNADGSLDTTRSGLSATHRADVVTRAHAAGRKVLLCVGGAGSQLGFQGATTPARLPTFVSNLTQMVSLSGYDGVDLDWEPIYTSDAAAFTNLVRTLRSALNQLPRPQLLTVAATPLPPFGESPTAHYRMFASVQNHFDQINVMAYDLSGPWSGWITWFNAPLFDGGTTFPSTGALVPSVEGSIRNFINNGVSPAKLGLGIPFYGTVWTGGGVGQPRQSWPDTSVPTMTTETYSALVSTYSPSNNFRWDNSAQSAYLSIPKGTSAAAKFISLDTTRACQSKVNYARNRQLGGVMIWELSQDYSPSMPADQRQPLLTSIREAMAAPGRTRIENVPGAVTLTFTGTPLGSYRVQWAADVAARAWNTLLVTNITGPGGEVSVTDPRQLGTTQRVYRVQSPP